MSSFTIRNLLKESEFKAKVPRKKLFLSNTHQERRLAFAKNYVNVPLSFWKKAQKLWGKEGEAFKLSCIRGTVKFGGGNFMVLGSMT